MTRGEVFAKAVAFATGKAESEVSTLLEEICAANPEATKGFDREMPDDEAQKQIDILKAEAPGMLLKLMRGAQDIARFESDTVH